MRQIKDSWMNPDAEIRNCEFRFKCPMTWDALSTTLEPKIRYCSQCEREVVYCKTASELKRAIIENQCVAVEIRPARGRMNLIVGDADPGQLYK